MCSRRLGLGQVEEAAWETAVRRFDEVCRTAGFMGLDEETVRNSFSGHTTRAPPVGFELATDSIQFYVIANLFFRPFSAWDRQPTTFCNHSSLLDLKLIFPRKLAFICRVRRQPSIHHRYENNFRNVVCGEIYLIGMISCGE